MCVHCQRLLLVFVFSKVDSGHAAHLGTPSCCLGRAVSSLDAWGRLRPAPADPLACRLKGRRGLSEHIFSAVRRRSFPACCLVAGTVPLWLCLRSLQRQLMWGVQIILRRPVLIFVPCISTAQTQLEGAACREGQRGVMKSHAKHPCPSAGYHRRGYRAVLLAPAGPASRKPGTRVGRRGNELEELESSLPIKWCPAAAGAPVFSSLSSPQRQHVHFLSET